MIYVSDMKNGDPLQFNILLKVAMAMPAYYHVNIACIQSQWPLFHPSELIIMLETVNYSWDIGNCLVVSWDCNLNDYNYYNVIILIKKSLLIQLLKCCLFLNFHFHFPNFISLFSSNPFCLSVCLLPWHSSLSAHGAFSRAKQNLE